MLARQKPANNKSHNALTTHEKAQDNGLAEKKARRKKEKKSAAYIGQNTLYRQKKKHGLQQYLVEKNTLGQDAA